MLTVIEGGDAPKGTVSTVAALMSKILCVIKPNGEYSIHKGNKVIEKGNGSLKGRNRANDIRIAHRHAMSNFYDKRVKEKK